MAEFHRARPGLAAPVMPAVLRPAGAVLAALVLLSPTVADRAGAQGSAAVTLCTDAALLERMAAMEERLVGEDLGRIRLLDGHGGDRAATCREVDGGDLILSAPVLEWTGYDRRGEVTRWTARPATGPDGAARGLAIVPADPADADRRW